MRPKRRVALSKEASWRARVNTWPSMSTRRTDSSSDSTSNGDVSDGPSREASEAGGWHPIPWMEDEVKPNQEELSATLIAGIRSPPKEEGRTTVVFQSKVSYNGILSNSFYKLYIPSNWWLMFFFVLVFLRLEKLQYVFRVTALARLVFQCKVFKMGLWDLLRLPETPTTPVVKKMHEKVSIALPAGINSFRCGRFGSTRILEWAFAEPATIFSSAAHTPR